VDIREFGGEQGESADQDAGTSVGRSKFHVDPDSGDRPPPGDRRA